MSYRKYDQNELIAVVKSLENRINKLERQLARSQWKVYYNGTKLSDYDVRIERGVR